MLKTTLFLALSIYLLIACSTVVEHARIEVSEDLTSSIQVLVSEDVTYENIESKRHDLERYANAAKACGALTKLFGDPESGQLYLQANIQLKTRDEIDVAARCGTHKMSYPKLMLETSESLFSKKYHLDFEMQSGMFDFLGRSFPKEFTFTLPGKIAKIRDDSNAIAYEIKKTQNGDNRITLHIEPVQDSELEKLEKQLQLKLCGNRGHNCELKEEDIPESMRYATLKLGIWSDKSKYDLQTITAVLGFLFGSGIVLEVLRKWQSNRRTNKSIH